MTRLLCALAVGLLLSSPAFAQTATPASKFVVDQAAPSLAVASSYVFRLYLDTASGSQIGMTCVGTVSPYQCSATIPAMTQGTHSAAFTAADPAAPTLESAKSNVVTFTLVIVPQAPSNARIQ